MNYRHIFMVVILLAGTPAVAQMNHTQMAVWVNEAIVSTYTYDATDLLLRQKEMAHYFTAGGWISYLKALDASQLPESVKKNKYKVSAVATLPPSIRAISANHWEATMPLLVLYKNPHYQQTQSLEIVIDFIEVPSGQGVRGLAMTSMQAKAANPPCVCKSHIP